MTPAHNAPVQEHRSRKAEHLSICLECQVEPEPAATGLEHYRFAHEALPEIDLDDVDVSTALFGRAMNAPFVISSMTGGFAEGGRFNRMLAEAAQELGIAMGVGSQRVALLDPALAPTFQVRAVAPDILLFANLGAIQLNNGFTVDDCRAAVEMISADALVLHLNPLQESVQPGGNTNFDGLAGKIEEVCARLELPVVVKEVGHGISEQTARILRDCGVSCIDTAGAGGTSWSRVEAARRHNGKSEVGTTFQWWGIPTADSICMCRRAAPDLPLIGSGGIRSGLDAAKAIALGADLAGFGLPLLREAVHGVDAVIHRLNRYREELRTAMFCTGTRTIPDLKRGVSLRKACPTCGNPHGL